MRILQHVPQSAHETSVHHSSKPDALDDVCGVIRDDFLASLYSTILQHIFPKVYTTLALRFAFRITAGDVDSPRWRAVRFPHGERLRERRTYTRRYQRLGVFRDKTRQRRMRSIQRLHLAHRVPNRRRFLKQHLRPRSPKCLARSRRPTPPPTPLPTPSSPHTHFYPQRAS